MSASTAFLVLFFAIFLSRVVEIAFLATLRSLRPAAPPEPDWDLADRQQFIDGWRACESCRRLPHSIDNDHILHHFTSEDRSEKCAE